MQSDSHADPRDTLPEAPVMAASTSDPAFYRPYSAPLYSSLPNGVPMHLPPPHSFQPLAHTFQPLVNHAYSAHLPPIIDSRFSSSPHIEEDVGDSLRASTSGKTFVCSGFDNCSMAFSRSEHLARHVRKHTGEKPFTCRCGKKFTRLDNLRQHASTIHHDEPEANEELFAQLSASMPRAGRNIRRKSSQQKRPASASTATPTSSSPSVLRQQQTPCTADAALRHEAFQRSATSSGSTTPALSPEYMPAMPQSAPLSTSQPASPALRMPVAYYGNTSAHVPSSASPSTWPYAYSQARYGASTLPQHGMPIAAPPAYPYHYVHSASTSHSDQLRYPSPYGHSHDTSHVEQSVNHGYSYSLRADPHVEPVSQADQSLHAASETRGQEQAQGESALLDRGNEAKDLDHAAGEGQSSSSASATNPVLPSLSSLIAGAPVAANASLELRPLTPRSASMSEHANKPTSELTGHPIQFKPRLMQPQYSSSIDMSRSSSLSSMGGHYAMPAASPSTTLSGTSPSTHHALWHVSFDALERARQEPVNGNSRPSS